MPTYLNRLGQNFRKSENGNVAVIFGMMIMPLTLSVGLAVDFGRSTRAKADMQSALDAGAIAAIKSSPEVAELQGTRIFTANFRNDLVTTPVVNFDVQANGQVKATARGSIPLIFGGLVGIETYEIATKSTIEPERQVTETTTEEYVFTGGAPCLHVMDQSDLDSLTLNSNTNVDGSNCDVRVRSNRSRAMKADGNSNLKFRSIKVKGQSANSGGLQITGWPYTVRDDAAIVSNPYLDSIRDVVQSITVGTCTNANTGKTWTGNVQPGTYCGATTFRNATFGPGLYIIKSSSGNKTGSLSFDGSINGSAGVSFYLADNKSKVASYTATAGSVLSAPTSGITRGLLIFENSNRGSNWDLSVANLANQSWEGLVYLPSANLTLSNFSGWEKFKVSLAANTVQISNWNTMTWDAFVWVPFNQSSPILYEDDSYTGEETTVTDKPLYIAQ